MDDEKLPNVNDDALKEFAAILQQREVALEQILAAINADFGLTLRFTCTACPVQVEGEVDGLTLYFRSRWDSWSLAIAKDLDQAVRANRQADAVFYHESSAGLSGFDASWLEPAEVDQVLRACLTAFRAGQTNAGYVELGVPGG
jgi:hypothetical protein